MSTTGDASQEKLQMDQRLSEFEQRIDQRLTSMATSVDKLATTVQLLADRDIRMQERESRQQEFNTRIGSDLDLIKRDLSIIQIARAEEKHAIEGVRRAYPWLICLATVLPVVMGGITVAYLKDGAPKVQDQRAVVPLVQTYDPRNSQQAPRQFQNPQDQN